MEKKDVNQKMWIGFKKFFANEYHDLNLTQNLSVVHRGYHSVNAVVPTGDIVSTLDNLAADATEEQSHVVQIVANICRLKEKNKILGNQINQLSKTNKILASQGQEEKNPAKTNESYLTKLDPTGYC